MVIVFGIACMVLLVWLLVFSMATESNAEQRRLNGRQGTGGETPGEYGTKPLHAA
ncbi:hypothetical protein [Candidatus Nitrospira bockiana]